ncbi:M16 family metallopeptidase [Nitrosomonas europaea]|uniref:M16 family metallopeptidase n=1 Tax=Nitrosomonas europaea TaxID=915 RepID=UPI00079C0690|nr:pitrilysin family protein [Nitrosomonas europaea]KXK41257.1 MAG: insulinase family protein [Nitrosomonas europaea]
MRFLQFLIMFWVGLYAQWALAFLPIQHWQTANGAQVYFVENHDLPILDLSIEFPAGSSTDTAETSGRAGLVQRLMSMGAGDLSEDRIAETLADVGARLGGTFDLDRAGLSLRTLSHQQERVRALDVLAQIVQRPEFLEKILERERARIIAALKEADTKPEVIADRTLMKLLYGKHPYGLRESGEPDALAALRRQDLVDFYRAHYTAGNAIIAMIGDIKRDEAARIAEMLTRNLPTGKTYKTLPPVENPVPIIQKIAHPATQSHIQIAYPGLSRKDPDYFPLLVGNYILGGGGFVSRLMNEIRETRGLAYSVYSTFAPYQEKGPFEIGLQTKKEQAEQALQLTQKTLRDFVEQGPTEEELQAARQNIVGGFPLRIDSNQKILGYLGVIGFYDLPLTYLEDYVKAVEKVTVAQIRDAFKRRIDPAGMVTVVVGAAD